jgi:hypothetical protein
MIENEHVRTAFYRILEQRPDVGDAKIIANWFFAQPNIFDPKPKRRLKPSVAIGLIYITLVAAICAVFNVG